MSSELNARRDVFISYDSRDVALAEALEATLKAAGLTVWRDNIDLRSGDPVRQTIPKALREAGAVAVIWSENSVTSAWVTFEAHYAIGAGKIAPLAVDGFDAGQLGKFFKGDHYQPLSAVLADPACYVARLKELAATPYAGMQILHPDIRPVPGFTGREDLLESVNRALRQKGGTAALTNDATSAAVKGLGGVGKSVLAREYAWRERGRYHGVWWVRAETEQTLIDDLIDLGGRLIPNLKEVAERDRALHLALDAIAGSATAEKPWLIVYDNVEKPGALRLLTPKTSAHILITSRWPRWQGHAQELPVDVFPEATAVDFLLAERPHETREAAGRLAAALGHLPLALSHARAYCAETNLSFDDYARRLAELIQEAPEDAEYPASVFATFSLAIAKAAKTCPEAEVLMAIAAFLAPDRIPLDIITADVMSEKQRERAVAALFKVSLITHETLGDSSRGMSVHRLVQEVMRRRLGDLETTMISPCLKLVLAAVPRGEHSLDYVQWPRFDKLLPHASAVLQIAPDSPEVAFLSNQIGTYLQTRAAYEEVELLYRRALEITEKTLGKDRLHTATYLNNLAQFYSQQGRFEEAEPLFRRALEIVDEDTWKEPSKTCGSLNNLAALYHQQGRYEEAEPLFRRALEIAEKALGKDHPCTGTHLNNLAVLYHALGRCKKVEPLHRRALDIAKKVLGKEDPSTGAILNNLAAFYCDQGRYGEAEPLLARAVAIVEKSLDLDHPNTKTIRANYEVLRKEMVIASGNGNASPKLPR